MIRIQNIYYMLSYAFQILNECGYKQVATEEFENGSWSTGSPFHSLYHELGHAVQHMILDNDTIAQRRIDMPNWKRNREKKEITDAP